MTLIKRNRTFPVFGSMFSDFFNTDPLFENDWSGTQVPAVNVKENKDNFQIEVAAPGISKEDFKVTLENGILKIAAEVKEEHAEEEENYTRKEFSYTSFKRSFTLPDNVLQESMDATYKDGVLCLTLEKKEEAKVKPVRSIEIR